MDVAYSQLSNWICLAHAADECILCYVA